MRGQSYGNPVWVSSYDFVQSRRRDTCFGCVYRSFPMPGACPARSGSDREKLLQKIIFRSIFTFPKIFLLRFFLSQNDQNIITFPIQVIKVLHFEIGLGWDHFFGGVPAQSSRREASTQPIFDRLDIFFDAIDLKNALVLLFLLHLCE